MSIIDISPYNCQGRAREGEKAIGFWIFCALGKMELMKPMLSHVVKISNQTGDKTKAAGREIAGPVSRKPGQGTWRRVGRREMKVSPTGSTRERLLEILEGFCHQCTIFLNFLNCGCYPSNEKHNFTSKQAVRLAES